MGATIDGRFAYAHVDLSQVKSRFMSAFCTGVSREVSQEDAKGIW